MYVFGGHASDGSCLNSIEALDAQADMKSAPAAWKLIELDARIVSHRVASIFAPISATELLILSGHDKVLNPRTGQRENKHIADVCVFDTVTQQARKVTEDIKMDYEGL